MPQVMGFYEPFAGVEKDVLDRLQELIELNRHNVRYKLINICTQIHTL